MTGTAKLDLHAIALRLEGLEETIIARLIDRAQYHYNDPIYEPGKSGFAGEDKKSLFFLRLHAQERMDAEFGRFLVPEERPYYHRLPAARRHMPALDTGLAIDDFDRINLMREIVDRYVEYIGRICRKGDDGHYGSSTEHDVYAVQALARRIHYGSLYIAESKYRAQPDIFDALAKKRDTAGIIQELTRQEVEERILERIAEKTAALQGKANERVRHIIKPEIMAAFYKETVIPLTKKGEALYLLNRGK